MNGWLIVALWPVLFAGGFAVGWWLGGVLWRRWRRQDGDP